MLRILKYAVGFAVLAGVGIILGCYIYGVRTYQTTLQSGVAFVRELPQGERVVGYIETKVFSYIEQKNYEDYKKKYEGKIELDPNIRKMHENLYKGTAGEK